MKNSAQKNYSHDVKAMAAADSNAGLIYVCNPNNPTGTLTSRSDIEWLLANKPKDSILLVDEAYVHIAGAPIAPHSGAEPTRPITADLTTVIGTGPVEISIVSIPCRKLAGIFFHLLLMPAGVCRSVASNWSGLSGMDCRRRLR